jgi:hypothetical protein
VHRKPTGKNILPTTQNRAQLPLKPKHRDFKNKKKKKKKKKKENTV